MNLENTLGNAFTWGQAKHPYSTNYRHAAFAKIVSYMVTGASGGYGGPSIREYAVSWALAGDGFNVPTEGSLTMQFPDGRLPRAGEWEFEQACQFAEPICYGILPAIAKKIVEQEHCFDDDPQDLEKLWKI